MLTIVTLFAGLFCLIGGADLLVRGGSALAARAGTRPALISLLVAAAGTSAPEFAISVVAGLEGRPDLAIANVLGSNTFNILLILGLSAVIRPIDVAPSTLRLEWPALLLASLSFVVLGRDGRLDAPDGLLLLCAFSYVTSLVVWLEPALRSEGAGAEFEEHAVDELTDRRAPWTMLGVGLALLAVGGEWFDHGALEVARWLGVSDRVIGASLVAIGTSLPELVTSVVATLRGEPNVAVAHILGSNLFNLLFILGFTALIHPLAVSHALLSVDAMWMIGSAAVLFPLMLGSRITRPEGGLLLITAGIYGVRLFVGE